MNRTIHLTDNNYQGICIPKECIQDVQQISEIGYLKNAPDLLVFPHSFSELKDGLGELSIVSLREAQYKDGKCVYVKACTGNLMGFVGVNETSISIHSRFSTLPKNEDIDSSSPDNFLYYMLQKVFSINIFSLDHSSSSDDNILDFLLFLFPLFLKKAISQGLFKEYRRYPHDDSKVKGVISVSRFILKDIPFRGSISYTTREYSYDNAITQLIRHTIEFIKLHPFGNTILNSNSETIAYVRQIVECTPSYKLMDRQQVLNKNLRPKVHPYFTKYIDLQKLCIQILKHDSLRYGKEKDKIHGILFDGAWLWEEYLNTILRSEGFKHSENKLQRGELNMFEEPNAEDWICGNSRKLYPDFYKDNFILDAKYKHLNQGIGREDLYQVVTYMYCTMDKNGGYVYPSESDDKMATYKLKGYGGFMHLLPMFIPKKDVFYEFIKEMSESEKKLKEYLKTAENRE